MYDEYCMKIIEHMHNVAMVLWTQGKNYDVWMHHVKEKDFIKLTKVVSYFYEFSTICYNFSKFKTISGN